MHTDGVFRYGCINAGLAAYGSIQSHVLPVEFRNYLHDIFALVGVVAVAQLLQFGEGEEWVTDFAKLQVH